MLVACQHWATTWTNVSWSSVRPYGIHLRAVSQEMLIILVTKMCYEITSFEITNGSLKIRCINSFRPGNVFVCQWIKSPLHFPHQSITWTNDGILWIGTLETNWSEILIKMQKKKIFQVYILVNVGCTMVAMLLHPLCVEDELLPVY